MCSLLALPGTRDSLACPADNSAGRVGFHTGNRVANREAARGLGRGTCLLAQRPFSRLAGFSVCLSLFVENGFTFRNSQLAKGDVMTVNIGVGVRLTLDEGYDPPQGTPLHATFDHASEQRNCRVRNRGLIFILTRRAGSVFIDDSKIFQGEGFWSVLEDTDEGVPTAFQVLRPCGPVVCAYLVLSLLG